MMHKKYKKCKMLTLYVDEEQEQMIKTLFDQNSWEYIKIGKFQFGIYQMICCMYQMICCMYLVLYVM